MAGKSAGRKTPPRTGITNAKSQWTNRAIKTVARDATAFATLSTKDPAPAASPAGGDPDSFERFRDNL